MSFGNEERESLSHLLKFWPFWSLLGQCNTMGKEQTQVCFQVISVIHMGDDQPWDEESSRGHRRTGTQYIVW